MAVSVSTIAQISGTDGAAGLIYWTSLASGANNTKFYVGNMDVSKVVFLVMNRNSTDVGTTAGYLYVGTSDSATTGTSYNKTYSGSIKRVLLKTEPPTTDGKEGTTASSAAAHVAITAFGPFETANLKTSDGYIKMSKRKGTSDLGRVKVAAILIP
jgi:hypothetical protein